MANLEILDADVFAGFSENPSRILILSKSDCQACKQWQEELETALAAGDLAISLPIGKLNLDQRGLGDFKKENEWLKEITDLPFNVIYKDGQIEKKWAGGKVDRLLNRLRGLSLVD